MNNKHRVNNKRKGRRNQSNRTWINRQSHTEIMNHVPSRHQQMNLQLDRNQIDYEPSIPQMRHHNSYQHLMPQMPDPQYLNRITRRNPSAYTRTSMDRNYIPNVYDYWRQPSTSRIDNYMPNIPDLNEEEWWHQRSTSRIVNYIPNIPYINEVPYWRRKQQSTSHSSNEVTNVIIKNEPSTSQSRENKRSPLEIANVTPREKKQVDLGFGETIDVQINSIPSKNEEGYFTGAPVPSNDTKFQHPNEANEVLGPVNYLPVQNVYEHMKMDEDDKFMSPKFAHDMPSTSEILRVFMAEQQDPDDYIRENNNTMERENGNSGVIQNTTRTNYSNNQNYRQKCNTRKNNRYQPYNLQRNKLNNSNYNFITQQNNSDSSYSNNQQNNHDKENDNNNTSNDHQ
ncbi:PREDICTED: GATA zinc finger domain-containing protein 14-like [Polistes dominula]|uniref:GATA zinc finger domain-containing protein 14-like n=1 Tax=Polistes dominula TaxID=743375 RepID=A0ABM1JA91_POLDO|nr:PREDICTED: GATA zinc finger domain-containing protein 14-like [Polistes dominula]